ncbi:hypothetical protein ACNOYE_18965 [Nannocystaceae bacterium ST9]
MNTQTSPHIRRLPAALSLVSLLAAGCDGEDSDDASEVAGELQDVAAASEVAAAPESLDGLESDFFEIDTTPDDQGELELLSPLPLLARVERGTASVEWRDGGASGVLLLISGTVDDAPLLDMDTAESLTPVEAWVAVAVDQPSAVPDRLLARATPDDLALLTDAGRIEVLRAGLREKLGHATEIQAPPLEPYTYGTCTAGQISNARTVYGDGYTSSSTCGDFLGFQNTNRNYLYCNSPDCDYGLATMEGSCIPAVNDNAYIVGTLAAATMRSKTAGNPNFVTSTHRIRGFAYNCHGDSDVTMHMEYGGATSDHSVASGYYTGAVWMGSGHLPARPIAIDYVSYGSWDNGISASGATYLSAEFSITGNAGAGDFGIFCSDAQKSLTMSAGATANAYSWCIGSCSVGNCWD